MKITTRSRLTEGCFATNQQVMDFADAISWKDTKHGRLFTALKFVDGTPWYFAWVQSFDSSPAKLWGAQKTRHADLLQAFPVLGTF